MDEMKKFLGYFMMFLFFAAIFCLLWFTEGTLAAIVVFILSAIVFGFVLLAIELTL